MRGAAGGPSVGEGADGDEPDQDRASVEEDAQQYDGVRGLTGEKTAGDCTRNWLEAIMCSSLLGKRLGPGATKGSGHGKQHILFYYVGVEYH